MQNRKLAQEDEIIDLSHYWYLFRQHSVKLISLAFIVTVISVLVSFTQQPIYKATTSILIEAKEAKVVAIEDVYGLASESKEYFLTQYELLASRELAKRVVEKLKLVKTKEFNPYFETDEEPSFISEILSMFKSSDSPDKQTVSEDKVLEATIRVFHDSISVDPVTKTQLVNLSVESSSPKLATLCVNALAQSYIELQQDAKSGMNKKANAWLTKRLDELRNQLKTSEKKLQEYQRNNNLIDVKGSSTLVNKELENVTAGLVDARTRRLELESTYKKLQNAKSRSYLELSTLPAVLKHPLVQKLRGNEASAELKISELSKRYGYKHPTMIAARSELKAAQNTTLIQMRRIADGIKNDYKAALNNERSLEVALEDVKSKIRGVSRSESKMNEFVREVEANKELYKTFYRRVRETNVTDDLQLASARVIDPATVPYSPIRPNKKATAAIAFFATLIFAFALLILYDMLNSTIKTPEDVDYKLGVPMLGLVPIISDKVDKKRWAFNMADNSDRRFCESVRTVRTSITLATMESAGKVLMITSSIPSEGKSTTVINLATAYAQMNEKVLLIDADMRKPKVANALNLGQKNYGLSNAIANPSHIEECTQYVEALGLDVLVSGTVCSNPLELLSSNNFKGLLNSLREKYDRILIDTAPLQSVSDALYLSTIVDGTIYIVKSDSTQDKYVKNGIRRLQKSKSQLLGVVLNQVDVDQQKRIGSGAYSGYYDYFDYGADNS